MIPVIRRKELKIKAFEKLLEMKEMIFDADGKFFKGEGIKLDQLELHRTGQMLNQKDSLAHNGI